MRNRAYALKGKDVPANLAGVIINVREAETLDECRALAGGDETSVVETFNDGVIIALQGKLRTASGKEGATVESLQKIADEFVKRRRAEGTGTTREVKPETRAKRAATGTGNKVFEKCLADESFLNRMVKQDLVDLAEFEEWKVSRETAAAGK